MGYLFKSEIEKLLILYKMVFLHNNELRGLACGSRFVWVIMCVWAPLHSCITSCSVLSMNISSNRHIYQLRTFAKMLKKKNIKLESLNFVCTSGLPRRRHTQTIVTFWPSYGLQSVSEWPKIEPEAPMCSKVQQEVITPLHIYTLSDEG